MLPLANNDEVSPVFISTTPLLAALLDWIEILPLGEFDTLCPLVSTKLPPSCELPLPLETVKLPPIVFPTPA